MNNIEFYRFGDDHYFIDNDNDVQGKIILSFGVTYTIVSYIEFDQDDLEEEVEQAYLNYISDHVEDAAHADGI